MPIPYRGWFIDRINKEFKKAQDANQSSPTRAAHDNTPEARQMQGMARDAAPSRLRRFT